MFATPRRGLRIDDCDFYHTVEVPSHELIRGQWDLRGKVDDYLGNYDFAGKRVLEIGPASGFLTFEMERRGAEVVALEVPDDPGWDFVPYPDEILLPLLNPRRQHMTRLKNSFWLLHQLYGSKVRLCYGDACNMPEAIGRFDVAVMASVLLHCERPVRIIAECAKRADTLIITDLYRAELEGSALCLLAPSAENRSFETWWQFSTDFIRQYLGVIGVPHTIVTQHDQLYEQEARRVPFFTLVGSKFP